MASSKIKRMMKYRWADSIRRGVVHHPTAEVAHKELERIRHDNGGRLKAEALVNEARSASSPFHKSFEWNDKKAAHQSRLAVARLIIRSIVVERVGQDPHHAYFQVHEQRARFYGPAHEVLSNRVYAEQLLNEAEAYYLSGRSRYEEIARLARVHGAIDATFGRRKKKA